MQVHSFWQPLKYTHIHTTNTNTPTHTNKHTTHTPIDSPGDSLSSLLPSYLPCLQPTGASPAVMCVYECVCEDTCLHNDLNKMLIGDKGGMLPDQACRAQQRGWTEAHILGSSVVMCVCLYISACFCHIRSTPQ